MTALLTIEDLSVRFRLRDAVVQAVTNLNLSVRRGELLAVVGESGCGKSVLAHALLGLLPANATATGHAFLARSLGSTDLGSDAIDLVHCGEKRLAREVRGRRIGLVPQSPATALTPVRAGRKLLTETLREHGRDPALASTVAADAGLDDTDLDRYPFQLSGGMAQRLVTALALASDPPLLIADEPTTGLDRPLVDHTLDTLRRRCDNGGAVLLITHDLAAAERVADTVAVMYASRIVEHRPASAVFKAAEHPYTAALLDALPDRAFRPIPGHPPMLTTLPVGCSYAPRCPRASAECATQPTGPVACHNPLVVS